MAVAISTIENRVLTRLEESLTAPKFWSVQDEVRVAIVEAANEAALITGEPQFFDSANFSITANTTIFSMPPLAIGLLRMEDPTKTVKKATVHELDSMAAGWQAEAAGTALKNWFPFGLSRFGVYPQLTSAVNVKLSYVKLPVSLPASTNRPYLGTETVNFQEEFIDALARYASSVLRLKEGGKEFMQAIQDYEYFLEKMVEFSRFGLRKGSLRFSRPAGVPSSLTPVQVK